MFRPPYGRIKKTQFKLISEDYKVVFWDVLSYDYDKFISAKKCLSNSIKHTRNGSIIVFHDSLKAQKKKGKIQFLLLNLGIKNILTRIFGNIIHVLPMEVCTHFYGKYKSFVIEFFLFHCKIKTRRAK